MPRLTLLLPETRRFAGAPLPASLASALGRADRATGGSGEAAQLARHFRLLPDRWSQAALTRAADAGIDDATPHAWLRADPAYIRPDINGARLLAIGSTLGIEQADVDALLPALRPVFGDSGFILDAPHPSRWYLRLPREARLPAFASPQDALGEDVFDHDAFATSRDVPEARRWRVLLSETQVVLHNHPHNAARTAAGKVPVNALWCWGGGTLPDGIAGAAPTLYSDDPLLHGIARVGKLQAKPLDAFANADAEALVDLRGTRDPRALLERWLPPIVDGIAKRGITLDFADGAQFVLHGNQRWRFWRRPLASLTS
jgi:hypothetical protein